MTSNRIATTAVMGLMTLVVSGCSDTRRHSLSEKEWDQIIKIPADNTEAAKELVSRDAQSRQQWLVLHDELQAERSEIGHQRDLLEADRRVWDRRTRQDPIIAEAIGTTGLLVACMLPLVLMAILLWPRKQEAADESLSGYLLDDVKRLPRRRIERRRQRRIGHRRENPPFH